MVRLLQCGYENRRAAFDAANICAPPQDDGPRMCRLRGGGGLADALVGGVAANAGRSEADVGDVQSLLAARAVGHQYGVIMQRGGWKAG